MDNRIPPGSYFQYSTTGVRAPIQRSSSPSDRERYLAELLAERQNLGPFMQLIPVCSRLLNQEIMRVSGLSSNQGLIDHERMGQDRACRSLGQKPNGGPMNVEAWSSIQTEAISAEAPIFLGKKNRRITALEDNLLLQRMASFQASTMGWHASPGIATTPVMKRVIRLDVPVEKFPNYNFVGRILGPRGNSLKRIEAMTECRIYIRGRGSVKDSVKEEKLKDKPGYEHLNEPLHLLVEAEFPEDIIDSRLEQSISLLENLLKPVDESMDIYKKQQLRELAMLNGTLWEESPCMSPSMSPSMSPFNSTGMKRAKTGR